MKYSLFMDEITCRFSLLAEIRWNISLFLLAVIRGKFCFSLLVEIWWNMSFFFIGRDLIEDVPFLYWLRLDGACPISLLVEI